MSTDILKQALGAFPTGVTVITVHDAAGRPHGMTANAFCSVSVDPPLLLVCVNRSAQTHGLILERRRFGVNILAEPHEHISRHCARPGSDKLLQPEWLLEEEEGSAPHLREAAAYFDCEIAHQQEAGTHSIFIGRVQLATARPHDPLLYYRGAYRRLAS
jgi:flavin reductase (DIM6/NTAB) family NADH-FMN oxidoreductase RutF